MQPRQPSAHIPECPAGIAKAGKPLFGPRYPWLAPLAGYSDLSFRLLCREYGAATCVTEMISAKGLFYGAKGTAELLASVDGDQPLVVQLFGGDAPIMGEAVRMLRQKGYNWFDCNLGCSVRKMLRQNAGASLLASPERVLEIARAMLAAANAPADDAKNGNAASEPGMVGFKLRLGIDSRRKVLPDLALRLEDAGASWLALHPRYAAQGFGGQADWSALADLAGRLDIPLLASGDLLEAEDGLNCIAQCGVSGVMYARGALRDPSIFARHLDLAAGRLPPRRNAAALRRMIDRHAALARKYCNPRSALLKLRSIVPRYARLLPGVNSLRQELCQCQDWEQLPGILDRYL